MTTPSPLPEEYLQASTADLPAPQHLASEEEKAQQLMELLLKNL